MPFIINPITAYAFLFDFYFPTVLIYEFLAYIYSILHSLAPATKKYNLCISDVLGQKKQKRNNYYKVSYTIPSRLFHLFLISWALYHKALNCLVVLLLPLAASSPSACYFPVCSLRYFSTYLSYALLFLIFSFLLHSHQSNAISITYSKHLKYKRCFEYVMFHALMFLHMYLYF